MPDCFPSRRRSNRWVRQPYPRWGEEIALDAPNGAAPSILRVLAPPVPASAPAGLLLVHGMNEYIGRYGEIARHFAERYIVAGFDLPAHGLSNPVLEAADRAIRNGAPAYDAGGAFLAQAGLDSLEPLRQGLHRALSRLIEVCESNNAGPRPVFILAHSLGALVAASYLLRRRSDPVLSGRIGGIALLGPAFAVSELPGWRGWLANPILRLSFAAEMERLSERNESMAPRRLWATSASRGLNGLFAFLSRPGWRNWVSPGTPAWVPDYLTDSEEERDKHRADAYIVRRSLLSYVKGIEREIVAFRHGMREFSVPYLLVYSERDPITASWGARDFAAATRSKHPDNEVLFLAGRYHHEHLFASPAETAAVLERIDLWLEKRLSGLGKAGTSRGDGSLKGKCRERRQLLISSL